VTCETPFVPTSNCGGEEKEHEIYGDERERVMVSDGGEWWENE